ncbi:transmembrane protein, putative (macronuclear) [Tetrahymena thermophila SB210]|uniref:Transmembrane protein, putative n=1 Tax=Tetrahymena thermophila (strain SB210) TaxID=312017 RepID=Q234W2_TETTS|nr:transmembrane protein, putative [Tetrahymena thermophila SB210]EAR91891.3 transmembrane protein, putative [Tetrahymena thermophila SB210]|eukprot:XP_001012136.3 transmembrane protein, putative [Tetrahymena thermophila SB210]
MAIIFTTVSVYHAILHVKPVMVQFVYPANIRFIFIKMVHVQVLAIPIMVISLKIVSVFHVILPARLVMANLTKTVCLVKIPYIFIKIKHVQVLVIPKMDITLMVPNVYLVILPVRHALVNLAKIVQLANHPFNFKIGNSCLPCNSTCKTCNGSSNQNCLSCKPSFYLYQDKIQQNEAGSCQSCDQSCLKCQGPSNKDCITCKKNYILLPTLRKCALCEEGYFFNQSSCDQCDQTCLTCTGKNKQDCIDCRQGLILSSVSKTCEKSSQVQNEQERIKYSQDTGCYDQKQQQVVSTCLDQIENSQSNTKILDTLFIVNLSLIAVSSIFTPLGSSLGWIFIQNQQLLGNYIFAYKLVPLRMNQLEMKSSYAHHFFTIISNIVIVKTNNEAILFQLKQFNTLFTINDFWSSFLNNCFVALIVFGFCFGILIIFICLNLRQIQDQTNSRDIAQFSNLVQNIEISNTSQRIFWLLFEWKKSLYILQQLYFLESSLLKIDKQIRTIFQNQIQICEMRIELQCNVNMVEQMTDSNIEKLFEMLNQPKKKNQLNQ